MQHVSIFNFNYYFIRVPGTTAINTGQTHTPPTKFKSILQGRRQPYDAKKPNIKKTQESLFLRVGV